VSNNTPEGGNMQLDELGSRSPADQALSSSTEDMHSASELQAVYDVPVKVQAVLGKSQMEVNQLLKLAPGAVIELDRRVGEAVDIYVNNRLVARGEVVIVDEHLGVTMTEIVKNDKAA
jgi:flagellar motor switch protein FliN